MAELNTKTSIVDYLKSTGQDSSLSSRIALGKKYGIDYSKTADNYATENIALLKALQTSSSGSSQAPVVEKTQDVNTIDEANALINAGQQYDFNVASESEEPETRSSSSLYSNVFSQVSKSLTEGIGKRPEAIDRVKTYKSLREDQGITALETSLSDLRAEANTIKETMRARATAEKGKPVALNVIAGRISEEEAQEQERLDSVNNQITAVTNQLTLKYNIVDTIMKYTGEDYDDAVASYDSQLSQNISLMNTVKGIVSDIKSDQEKAQDNARANLQIIYNNLNSSNADVNALDESTVLNITKLELQAGLPQGFYKSVVENNPLSDILSTTSREENGKKYVDIVLRDSKGKITTESKYVGGVDISSSSSNLTAAEKKGQVFSMINQLLTMKDPDGEPYTGEDGFLTPKGFKILITNAGEDGVDRATFLSQYGNLINPDNIDEYGLTYKEKLDLSGY